MIYIISSDDSTAINLAPSADEEIVQNVRMIISSSKYDVPLNRNFGLSREYMHKPQNVAELLLVRDVTEAIEEYEPRALIKSVSTESTELGKIKITVVIEVESE